MKRIMSALLLFVGCYPAEITLVGSRETKTLAAAPTNSRGISATGLATVAGDVQRLEYKASERHRVFLMTPPLTAPASTGTVLQMPQPPTDGGLRVETVPTPWRWQSARVYDIGICGDVGSWSSVADSLADGFTAALTARAAAVTRVSASVTPLYKQTGSNFDDSFHFAGRWNVGSIGGCTNTFVTIDFDFSIRRRPGTRAVLRNSRTPSAACASVPVEGQIDELAADAGVFDFEAVVLPVASPSVVVDIGDICLAEPSIRGALEGAVKTTFPKAFADGIKSATTVPAIASATIGVPLVNCSCDYDCTPGALGVPGPRHRCVGGRCAVQLEPDRVESRPDGLGVVLADELTDAQASFYRRDGGTVFSPIDRFCNLARNTVTVPTTSVLPGRVPAP